MRHSRFNLTVRTDSLRVTFTNKKRKYKHIQTFNYAYIYRNTLWHTEPPFPNSLTLRVNHERIASRICDDNCIFYGEIIERQTPQTPSPDLHGIAKRFGQREDRRAWDFAINAHLIPALNDRDAILWRKVWMKLKERKNIFHVSENPTLQQICHAQKICSGKSISINTFTMHIVSNATVRTTTRDSIL